MASPHIYEDLLEANGGDLSPTLFPQLDETALQNYLIAKLDAGYARLSGYPSMTQAQQDSAALAWAYYEAYLAIWRRLSASPATAKIDGEAERVYLAAQIQTFKDLADMYLQRYEAMLPLIDGVGGGLAVITGVPTAYRF